jgi:hypothetical protein
MLTAEQSILDDFSRLHQSPACRLQPPGAGVSSCRLGACTRLIHLHKIRRGIDPQQWQEPADGSNAFLPSWVTAWLKSPTASRGRRAARDHGSL